MEILPEAVTLKATPLLPNTGTLPEPCWLGSQGTSLQVGTAHNGLSPVEKEGFPHWVMGRLSLLGFPRSWGLFPCSLPDCLRTDDKPRLELSDQKLAFLTTYYRVGFTLRTLHGLQK